MVGGTGEGDIQYRKFYDSIKHDKHIRVKIGMAERWVTVAEILTYVKCPHRYFMIHRSGRHHGNGPAQSCIDGYVIDAAIKRMVAGKLYIADTKEEDAKLALQAHAEEAFRFSWSRNRQTLGKAEKEDGYLSMKSCESMMQNFVEWLWHRMKGIYDECASWNMAYQMSKPMQEKLLHDSKLRLKGKPDGFLKDSAGMIIPLDYKASGLMTPEIRLQMVFYAILGKAWTGKLPPYAKALLLKESWPEKSFKMTRWEIEDALHILERFMEKTASDDIRDYPCMCKDEACKKHFTLPEFEPASVCPMV
jgi:hypothetical protein